MRYMVSFPLSVYSFVLSVWLLSNLSLYFILDGVVSSQLRDGMMRSEVRRRKGGLSKGMQ